MEGKEIKLSEISLSEEFREICYFVLINLLEHKIHKMILLNSKMQFDFSPFKN